MQEKLATLNAKLDADSALAEKLFSLENPTDVQSLLKEQGLEFSLEEISTIKDAVVKAVSKSTSGELSDEDLEDVAGGTVGQQVDQFIYKLTNFITVGGRRW